MIRILLSKKLGELRWTQAELARATGIRPSTINEYYHELTTRINLEHFDLYCFELRAFGNSRSRPLSVSRGNKNARRPSQNKSKLTSYIKTEAQASVFFYYRLSSGTYSIKSPGCLFNSLQSISRLFPDETNIPFLNICNVASPKIFSFRMR